MPNPNLDALIAIAEAHIATRTGSGWITDMLDAETAAKNYGEMATPELFARLARRLKLVEERAEFLRRSILDGVTGVKLEPALRLLREVLTYDGSPPVAGEEKR